MNQKSEQKLRTVQAKHWGQLTAIDLHKCRSDLLTSASVLSDFCKEICKEIGMVRYGEPIIKRFGEGDLEGYSAMQFIHTSTVVVHLDEFGGRAFIDIFSCKEFDAENAVNFSKNFFGAENVKSSTIFRG